MEEFVQIRLNTYNDMRDTIAKYAKENASLLQDVKDEIQEKERVIKIADRKVKNLHEYIMGTNLLEYKFAGYTLEQLTNFESYETFAISYRSDLLKLGITKEQMIDFIARKKEEYDKENEQHG